jgi:hypothetical protein
MVHWKYTSAAIVVGEGPLFLGQWLVYQAYLYYQGKNG